MARASRIAMWPGRSRPRAWPLAQRRWQMNGLTCLIILVCLIDRLVMSIAAPSIRDDLALTGIQMGLLFTVFQWTYAFAQVPAGVLVDRYGVRHAVLLAVVAWTAVTAATGLIGGLGALIAMRALLGIVEAPVFPAAIKMANAWFPENEKSRAVSILEVATKSGMVVSPLLGAYLIAAFGWRAMFVILACVSLVPAFLWWRHYRAPERDDRLSADERALVLGERSEQRIERPAFGDWLQLFRHSQTWMLMLGGLTSSAIIGLHNWIPLYLKQLWGFSTLQMGNAMALLGAAGIAGAFAGGLLADALFRRGMSALASRKAVIVLALVIASLAIFAANLAGSTPVMLVALTINAFGLSLIYAPAWSLVPAIDTRGKLVASLISLQIWGVAIGGGITPLAIGWLTDRGLDIRLAFSGCGAFGLISALVYGLLIRRPISSR